MIAAPSRGGTGERLVEAGGDEVRAQRLELEAQRAGARGRLRHQRGRDAEARRLDADARQRDAQADALDAGARRALELGLGVDDDERAVGRRALEQAHRA